MKRLALALLLVAGLATPAMANPVTVVNGGTSPGLQLTVNLPWIPYNGGALVGVENLTVDGTPYKGFCIDLYHFADTGVGGLQYNIDPLLSSPTAIPPGAMGAAKADFIKEMWAYGYANALLSNTAAADFQLAIWGVLQGSISGGIVTPDFTWLTSGSVVGANALITWANGNTGALANVWGLNGVAGADGKYPQSYAIGIPDGGATLILLGGALMGLGALRRKFRV